MSNAVIGALRVVLGMDSAAFNDGVGAAQKRVARFRKTMERTGRQLQRVGTRMTAGLTAPLVGLAYKSVAAQKEQERAIASVSAALESMGDGAGYTLSQLEAMASKLQDKSLYGDEEILSKVTANLLTFGNVQGDVFSRAQQVAVDLSARLGQDLQSSAIMLGKALNDPIQGLTALSRVGVSFTEQQKDQIKAMAEAGDVAGAQALMLAELEKQYSGQAEALASTDSGRITQAWNAIGDAMEKVGAIILPIIADFADYVKGLAEKFQQLSPETQKFIVIGGALAAAIGPVVTALGLMMTALAPMAGVIMAIVSPLGLLAAGIAAAGVAIYQNWGSLKEDFPAITGAIEGALDGLKTHFGNVMEAAGVFGEGLKEQLRLAATGVEALITGDFTAAWGALTAMFQNSRDTILGVLDALFGSLDERIMQAVSDMLEPFRTWISDMVGLLSADPQVLGAAIGASLAGLVLKVQGVREQIVGAFRSMIEGLQAMFQGDFASVWASGVEAVRQFGSDMLAALGQLLADVVQAALNIGHEIVAGIRRGLQEKWQDLKDYVSGLGSGIAQGFKDALGIRSPSRVFREFGRFIAQGLSLGMQDGEAEIETAADRLAGAASIEGMVGATRDMARGFKTAGSAAKSAFGDLGSLLSDAIRGTKSLGEVASGVFRNLANHFGKQAASGLSSIFTGIFGGGGDFFSSLFGGLFGFANGGSFEVGGAGGIDSQVVAFRASPNETVHVTKPGQGLSGGGGFVWTGDLNIQTDSDQPQEIASETVDALRGMISQVVDGRLAQSMRPGGVIDSRYQKVQGA
jgi:phage-related protein